VRAGRREAQALVDAIVQALAEGNDDDNDET
jgi:hypothetical protein